jgi:hypothetical protein
VKITITLYIVYGHRTRIAESMKCMLYNMLFDLRRANQDKDICIIFLKWEIPSLICLEGSILIFCLV